MTALDVRYLETANSSTVIILNNRFDMAILRKRISATLHSFNFLFSTLLSVKFTLLSVKLTHLSPECKIILLKANPKFNEIIETSIEDPRYHVVTDLLDSDV